MPSLPWLLAAFSPAVLLALPSIAAGALSDEPSLETTRPRHDQHSPFAEKQKKRRHNNKQSNRFVYQAYYGGTAEVDLKQLAQDQAAAGWTEAENPVSAGVTYSVIVVEWR